MKPERLSYYVGEVRAAYSGYAADPAVSGNAASGGFVTGLLSGMLRRGEIDGALVARLEVAGGRLRARVEIATDAEALRAAQGSIYFFFPVLTAETRQQLLDFPGRIAAVGLPCTIRALQTLLARDEALRAKIVLAVGLFCGHTSRPELIDRVLRKKAIDPAELASFRFRQGKWRGESAALLQNGEVRRWPTAFYTLYQNLFILSHPGCMNCTDHFAETADVACGDIWLWAHRHDEVKHSMIACRTAAGAAAVERAVAAGELLLKTETAETLFNANRRSCIFHKAIRARARVGRWFGVAVAVPPDAPPARWNELLAALTVIPLYKYSIGPNGARLFRLPRRLLKLWLYFFKLLTQF